MKLLLLPCFHIGKSNDSKGSPLSTGLILLITNKNIKLDLVPSMKKKEDFEELTPMFSLGRNLKNSIT